MQGHINVITERPWGFTVCALVCDRLRCGGFIRDLSSSSGVRGCLLGLLLSSEPEY